MKLIIVRHGDPDYINDSLTEKGWREAVFLSERLEKLDITKVYCSPLGRAKDTAKPTLEKKGIQMEICDWLRELPARIEHEAASDEHLPWDLYTEKWTAVPALYDKDAWLTTDIMQSGNVEPLYREVCEKLDALLARHGYVHENGYFRVTRENDDTVVIVCHFGLECVLLSHILHISPVLLWQGFVAPPSSVTTLITEERRKGVAYFRCNGFGDISHLYANGEPPSFAARFCECYSNENERH